MPVGAFLEPAIIVSLLTGGTLVNRDKSRTHVTSSSRRPPPWQDLEYATGGGSPVGEMEDDKELVSRSSSSTIWHETSDVNTALPSSRWRERKLKFFGWEHTVTTPNTEVHKDRFLSRVLRTYPFLVEVWYWALIYWVCAPRLSQLSNRAILTP